MTERELKLALPGRFTVPTLFIGDVPLEPRPADDLSLRATYYDTADLRLARHGVSLRYRTGEDGGPTWTLKLAPIAAGAVVAREELHFDGPGREPPPQARSLVVAHARTAPLVAVATLRTRRRRLRLGLPDDPEPIAELAIDEVSVVEGRRVVSRFRELELEDLRGDLDLDALADQLRAAGAIGAEPIPKVVRALGSRATAPPDVRPLPLPADATLADALAAAIADALHRLIRHDPLARLGEAEGVHQVRVAFRRLRSDLRTLGDAVDPAWRARVEPRLREVGSALAAARDLDVLVAHLREDTADEPRALHRLFRHLERRRAAAQAALHAALEDPGYAALLEELVDAVAAPPAGTSGGEPAAEVLPRLTMAAWRRLERRADALEASAPDGSFHRARIAAKRTRYAAELTARALEPRSAARAVAFADRIAGLQDLLGAIQDAAVAEATIRDTLAGGDTAYAFEAGRLVERQRARAGMARAEFLATWPQARRRKWRAWAS